LEQIKSATPSSQTNIMEDSTMNRITLNHLKLGAIKCLKDPNNSLVKVLGLPYGTISQRFARSRICPNLHDHPASPTRYNHASKVFDATIPGPCSIQPWGSIKSDASNIPLPTDNMPDEEEQSEDCLNLSIHLPSSALSSDHNAFNEKKKLPVLIFIHGGAYFLGSANRPYYSPINLLQHSITSNMPIIIVSINYRLGALGFWHASTPDNLIPENNGLHDQLLALEWVQENIGGFGGDPGNVTAMGQSAGGESLSILSNSDVVREKGLMKRVIMLSGTPVTMPAMTPSEHTENFLTQADKLGINIHSSNGKDGKRDVSEVAREVIEVDVQKIRELAWVGSPCTQTPLLPFDKPTMAMMRTGGPPAWRKESTIEAQIVGTTTYDGGISFNMMSRDPSRSSHATAFSSIATDVLGKENGDALCDIYGIKEGLEDSDALQRICSFESDIGFFAAALATAEAGLVKETYLQIFDLPNPFPGPIHELGEFATHTFDISTLLGGAHGHLLPAQYRPVISEWRSRIVDFVGNGKAPCATFMAGQGGGENGGNRKALVVNEKSVREEGEKEWMGERREKLFELADRVDRERGWDVLWVDVCRRFLMRGE
jgi:carboxylesterase type B